MRKKKPTPPDQAAPQAAFFDGALLGVAPEDDVGPRGLTARVLVDATARWLVKNHRHALAIRWLQLHLEAFGAKTVAEVQPDKRDIFYANLVCAPTVSPAWKVST